MLDGTSNLNLVESVLLTAAEFDDVCTYVCIQYTRPGQWTFLFVSASFSELVLVVWFIISVVDAHSLCTKSYFVWCGRQYRCAALIF